MKIDRITFTGADDTVSADGIQEMLRISEDYSFVEWAILVSKSQVGSNRFPSVKWQNDFFNAVREHLGSGEKINLSCHVCGKWVRELLSTGQNELFNDLSEFVKLYQRIQLNFHAENCQVDETKLFLGLKSIYTLHGKPQFIFQMDGVNDKLMHKARAADVNVVPLFDLSGGAGVVPDEWPKPFDDIYCGYAGGLGPHNIEVVLADIEEVVGDRTIWIDMETWVRNGVDDFDLDLCLQVLDKTTKYTN